MVKSIEMLNVREDVKIKIIVNGGSISVVDKDDNRLFFKIFQLDEDINKHIAPIINKHFEKGFVITTMNIFNS